MKYVSPAERYLVETVKSFLCKRYDSVPKIMNIGAGSSIVIENQIVEKGCSFVCDRIDLEKHQMDHSFIGAVYQCSIEHMDLIGPEKYNVVFANYLLEHVQNINQAASEIYRVLKKGGIFVTSIPNPTALESILAKQTPLWFHKVARGKEAWKTYYAYKDIEALCILFREAGFDIDDVRYWSSLKSYLKRFIVLNQLAGLYDKIINTLQYKRFMNNVCIVFKKPESMP